MHQKMDLNRLFPRNRYGRIALTLSGTFFLAVSIFPLILFLFHAPVPQGAFAWLFRILLTEFFTALLLFSLASLIWAAATPQWLESMLQKIASKIAVAIGLLALSGAVVAFYQMWLL